MRLQKAVVGRSERGVAWKVKPQVSKYNIMEVGDPKQDRDYVEAVTIKELRPVASQEWLDRQLDPGDEFKGWSKKSREPPNEGNVNQIIQDAAKEGLRKCQKRLFRAALEAGQWRSQPVGQAGSKSRFQIIKHLRQQTGLPIADHATKNVNTLGDFRKVLLGRPKPTKVASQFRSGRQLVDLPNVTFRPKRISSIDKEKEVGRWKIIEQELENRGLPIRNRSSKPKRMIII